MSSEVCGEKKKMLPHIENLTKVAKIIQSGSRVKHIGRITKKSFVLEKKKEVIYVHDRLGQCKQ